MFFFILFIKILSYIKQNYNKVIKKEKNNKKNLKKIT